MRIGMYRGDAMAGPIESLIDAARETDDAGFASLWLAEAMGMDAMTALAVVGREVPRIELGIAVVPTYPRHPIVMAQQALTTQSITGGRFVLGIGVSHPPIIENAYGYPFERPARHMREYLDALLPLVRDGRVDAEGETITARMTLNVRDASPVRVVLAALGSRMLELAGAAADGTVVFMTGSATLANHVVPRIRGAAESAGRPDPMIGAAYSVCVTDDADAARAAIDKRYEMIAALPSYRAMLEREGATRAADVHLVGDEASVRDQVEMLDELGVTDLVASIVGSPEERDRTRALLATLTQASK
jgi:5,10-methylenetetrahydromethanopterin reductase